MPAREPEDRSPWRWSGPAASPRGTAGSRPPSRRSAGGWRRAGTTSSSTAGPRTAADRRRTSLPRDAAACTCPRCASASLETLSHTGAVRRRTCSAHRTDAPFVFNAANAPLLPVAARRAASRSPRTSTGWSGSAPSGAAAAGGTTGSPRRLAVRWSDALIADAQGIARLLPRRSSARDTELIAYGAPIIDAHRRRTGSPSSACSRGGYHLVVARFEPENHVDVDRRGLRRAPARRCRWSWSASAPYAHEYTRAHRGARGRDDRVRFLGGVWDQRAARPALRARADLPARPLASAAPTRRCCGRSGAGTATIAYDVDVQPRGARRRRAGTSRTPPTSRARSRTAEREPGGDGRAAARALRERARRYDWDDVAARLRGARRDLVARRVPGPQRARRRPSQPAAEATQMRSTVP